MKSARSFTRQTRFLLGFLCFFFIMLLMAGAWTIPFVFESSTLFYKFGLYKALLRAGKIAGVTAAVLLFFQAVLVSRFRILDRIFALNRIYSAHRINGMVIAVLVLLHPALILASEGFTLFPLEKRYWPEFLGIGLSLAILGLVAASSWRTVFGVPYHIWLRIHRLVVLGVITAAGVHILYVSETFEFDVPRGLVFALLGLNALLILRRWVRRRFPGKRSYVVSDVLRTGGDSHALVLQPINGPAFSYLPGQFAFITPAPGNLPGEEHPFTLASSPSRPDTLQFVIRSVGDWTGRIGRHNAGDQVFVDGPYGLFSQRAYAEKDPLILIAGGIGITPMLSMLRFMADTNDQRPVVLIWSNRTRASIVLPEVFEDLERRLQQFKIIHHITRGDSEGDRGGRLDRATLDQLLEGSSRQARIFICGPPSMMKAVRRDLKSIGFVPSRIHTERFQF